MRVLMTTDTIGGVWTFTKELSAELLSRGCSIALISLGREPSTAQWAWVEAQKRRWGSRFQFEPSAVPLEWMTGNECAFDDGAPLLMRVAEDLEADLMLSSQFCFGALASDMPRIVVAHSDVLSWARACRPQGLEHSAWLETYCKLVAEGLREADAVVAPTHWMLDALAANFALPPQRCVIPNGRSLKSAAINAKRNLQAVTAGRVWDEAKNVSILRDVRSAVPLLIAGETELAAERCSIDAEHLRVMGLLNEGELSDLLRRSAIYVCTSVYEPFGLSPLEAGLCGCAVVANDIPSLREVWEDGALFFSGAESLSNLLDRLSGDRELLMRARERSMRRAEIFTAERMASKYLELFEKVSQQSLVPSHVA
jgi:glycogen(starch) synthase